MSQLVYPIVRIDPVIFPSTAIPAPVMSIQPTEDFLTWIQSQYQDHPNTNIRIAIRCNDTQSPYDNVVTYASVVPGYLVGGFRPNFFDATHQWGIVPELPWYGYPPNNGTMTILEWGTSIPSSTDTMDGNNEEMNLDQAFAQLDKERDMSRIRWGSFVTAIGIGIVGWIVYTRSKRA